MYTLGKFSSNAAIIAIVEAQTNAAELDSPDPIRNNKMNKRCLGVYSKI